MPVRFLSGAQRGSLAGFLSEVDTAVLERFFALGPADLAEVRRRRSDPNRLGWALQLYALRKLGFCPEDVRSACSRGGDGLCRPRRSSVWARRCLAPTGTG